MAMCFFVLVIGGGGYFLTREKEDDEEGEECTPDGLADRNANYETDEYGDCVFSECKVGYKKEGDWCLPKTKDYYISGGIQSKDCVISGYTQGPCKSKINGKVLTGYDDLYGDGYMDKYAIITEPATGNGKCENTKLENQPCRVEQVAQCKAPQELWTSDDAKCTAIFDSEKKDLITGSGFCGVGTKVKTLKESNITDEMLGGKSLKEYKKDVNWDVCPEFQISSCNVTCADGDIPSSCPDLSDLGWDSDDKCYVKEDAEKFILGEKEFGKLSEMKSIKRDDATRYGAFDTVTGVLNTALLPKGLKIYYLTGQKYDDEELRKNGCSVIYTKECIPELEPQKCEYTTEYGVCEDKKCGQSQERSITRTQTISEFAGGSCEFTPYETTTSGCNIVTKPCCDKSNYNHYQIIGQCNAKGKGTYQYDSSKCNIQGSTIGGDRETLNCCYVSNWVPGECNQDGNLDRRKYTRTVVNKDLCTTSQLEMGVGTGDIYNSRFAEVKYVLDETNCKKNCGTQFVQEMDPTSHTQVTNTTEAASGNIVSARHCNVAKQYKVTSLAEGTGTCPGSNAINAAFKVAEQSGKYCRCNFTPNEASFYSWGGSSMNTVCNNILHCKWDNGQCKNIYKYNLTK
jgi:hypothetical protein